MSSFFDAIYHLIDSMLPFYWISNAFMKRALLAVIFIAPTCAAIGVPATNFRMIFFSHSMSHSAFAGVALGILTGIEPRLAMILFGVIISIAITNVRRRSELAYDTVIGVFFSLTVALGIVIVSRNPVVMRSLDAIIYGDILTINENGIMFYFILFILTMLFLAFSYNRLLLKGINERLASSHGVRTAYYDYAFAILLSVIITASIRAVGLLLVTAMLVVPAGAARNISRSARQQFWFSILIGTFSGVSAIIITAYYNFVTGATIILIAGIIFMLTQYAPMLIKRIKDLKKRS
jgi:zinc transport system permease protein